MAANVADFSVVRDTFFTVDANGPDSERMNFKFRGGLLRDLEGIMTFMLRSADGLRLRIDINDTPVAREDIEDGTLDRMFQEVFPMSSIPIDRPGFGRQVVTFTAERGRGTFSDVVVWYRRDTE